MPKNFSDYVRSLTADQYWSKVVDSGWVAEIPPSQRADLEANVRAAFTRNPLFAWTALATVGIDSESIYETDPEGESYHAHIARLAENSDGVFQPTSIHNEDLGDVIRVTFQHGGRIYTYDAPADSDYFDIGVINLINQALADSGTTRRFMLLPAIDQVMYLAVVSEETYRRAVALGVTPPAEYFISKKW